jgi:hypothetical protein
MSQARRVARLFLARRSTYAQLTGEFELPPGHLFGSEVPKGGANCAKCKFLSEDKKHCGNRYFQEWQESLEVEDPSELPKPPGSYCCDVFEASKAK